MKEKNIKIAICDDDKQERESIVRYIECYYHDYVAPVTIEEFEKREILFDEVIQSDFDIIFVCLNGEAGIETAKKVRHLSKNCRLVIINDTSDYAIEAHSLWVNHYLMKPIRYDYICDALNRCEKVTFISNRM